MSERRVTVVMTASGRVKEYPAGSDFREVLEAVYNSHSKLPDYDPPSKLFVGGECVVPGGLTEIALRFGEYQQERYDELDARLDAWAGHLLGCPTESEAV